MFEPPKFRDSAWLQQALTHSSYTNEHPAAGEHNERLEFLGDSVFKYVLRFTSLKKVLRHERLTI